MCAESWKGQEGPEARGAALTNLGATVCSLNHSSGCGNGEEPRSEPRGWGGKRKGCGKGRRSSGQWGVVGTSFHQEVYLAIG